MGVHDVELYPREGNCVIAAPTNDSKVMVIAYWPHELFTAVRQDVPKAFDAVLDLVPDLARRVRQGRRTEPFRGAGDLNMYFRRPYGPGWALVGDAGHHKDPILALGITDAFRDAELVARALHSGLTGERSFEAALADYEVRRNRAALQGYRNTVQFAALSAPPPEVQAFIKALSSQPEQASRFMGATLGTVPAEDFFNPENLATVMAGASAARSG